MVLHAKSVTGSNLIFFIRTTSQLEDVDVLRRLVECQKLIVTPLLTTYGTLHHMRLFRDEDPKWKSGIDEVFSFYQTSLMAGNVTGIGEKFQSGTNFLTVDQQSTFWHPFGQDQSKEVEGIVNKYVLHKLSNTTRCTSMRFNIYFPILVTKHIFK
jgi:hypothetical protein